MIAIIFCPVFSQIILRALKSFFGSKTWLDVPKHLKEIAFRKPFSKEHKKFILDHIHEDMPPEKRRNPGHISNDILDLDSLFASDDENEDEEYFGF